MSLARCRKALRQQGIDARVILCRVTALSTIAQNWDQPSLLSFDQTTYATAMLQAQRVYSTVREGVPVLLSYKAWPYFGNDESAVYTDWDWDVPRFINSSIS